MRTRTLKITAGLLSFCMLWQSICLPVFLPGVQAADADSSTNPYVTSVVKTTNRPTSNTTWDDDFSGSDITIDTAEKMCAFARFSQTDDCAEKTIQLSNKMAMVLSTDFIGIGSAKKPFKGTMKYALADNANSAFELNNCPALFHYLSTSATLSQLDITANNASGTLAQNLIVDSPTPQFSRITVGGTVVNSYSGEDAGLLFGRVSGADAASSSSVTMDFSTLGLSASFTVTATNGNAGGLIGSIGANTSVTLINLAPDYFQATSKVHATMGNAGAMVGQMESGSALATDTDISVVGDGTTEAITAIRYYNSANDVGGNAGALVGLMGSGAKLQTGSVTIQNQVIGGGNSAGGAVGLADSATISAVQITDTTVQGAVNCGGFVGFAKDPVTPQTTQQVVLIPTNDPSFGKAAGGGMFGKLEITKALSLSPDHTQATIQQSANQDATQNNLYMGGLIGIFTANQLSSALSITGTVASAQTNSVATSAYGGVIGLMDTNTCCQMKNVTEATSSTSPANAGDGDLFTKCFGGAVAFVSDKAMLDIDTCTVTGGFCVNQPDANAGGLVGYLGNGAALCLLGNTILGAKAYGNTSQGYAKHSGQLVGYQDNGLVFSQDGWILTRNAELKNQAYKMDDIGNYGQVIRNDQVKAITKNADHTITISPIPNATVETVTIRNLTDYAKLAITLSTHGVFSGIEGVDSSNYSQLLRAKVVFEGDVNLTGSGIECLTKTDAANDAFSGSVDGGGHTLTLAVGEASFSGGTQGNGEVFGHPYLGMFAAINGATFQNLTLDGIITIGQFSDQKGLTNDLDSYAGGIAGDVVANVTITNVTTKVNITEKNSRANGNNAASYGGFFGAYYGFDYETYHYGNITITGCASAATITVTDTSLGATYYTGGMIGYLYDSSGDAVITILDTTLSGSITSNQSCAYTQVGGLIGYLFSAAGNPDQVKVRINGLTVKNQCITAQSTVALGGLLGYSWTNVEVLMDKSNRSSNTINGSVSSTGNANFGGLFYQIEGKLSVKNTTLSGSFSGGHSGTDISDGLLVCQGKNLYTVVDQPTVSITGIGIKESAGSNCDDLVGNSIINNNYGGIVSIETGGSIGSTATPWVYSNAVAQKQNKNTRYYYNVAGLDKDHNTTALGHIKSNTINNKDELLLWHLLNYTVNNQTKLPAYYFRGAFSFSDNKDYAITSGLDLSGGFCLYPSTISKGSYDLNNHTITFGNTDVAELSPSDVAELSPSSTKSQHFLMQTGLFFNVKGDLTFQNATLAGNVGTWSNKGSGALIVNNMAGSEPSGTKKDYTVPYLNINTLTLNGLWINGNSKATNQYAPLLINTISTCVRADFEGIVQNGYTSGEPAASSLIGKVGFVTTDANNMITSAGTHLILNFSNIVLEGEKTKSNFYRASLLNSFAYKADGSSNGTYNFNWSEDWTSDSHHLQQVTYGQELTAANTQYYDTNDYVSPSNNHSTATDPGFQTNYIPYVKTVNVANNYNPIDVNIKIGHLNKGCGTYEDPYIITTEKQLTTLANFINKNIIPDNWKVNKPKDDFCESKSDHQTYEYNTAENKAAFSSNITRDLLSHAYYLISGREITLKTGFTGLGTDEYPFAGVIIGEPSTDSETGTTIVPSITIPASAQEQPQKTAQVFNMGLINVGKGCVIRDLNICYQGIFEIQNPGTDNISTNVYYFGGVIGKVTGGDNIIDHVGVSLAKDSVVTVSSRLTYNGGYVGLLMAGGVVFRNMQGMPGLVFQDSKENTGTAVEVESSDYFYTNPYIGRTLDGFALVEKAATSYTLENTNKNYQIHTMTGDTTDVVISKVGSNGSRKYNRATVNGAEGLFVLSAAANSGALSTGCAKSYAGTARRRTAMYNSVGAITTSKDSDYQLSLTDQASDQVNATTTIKSNSVCYLAKYYMSADATYAANAAPTSYLTGWSQRLLILLKTDDTLDYDMSPYGNGFRGIGGQYATDAIIDIKDSKEKNDRNCPISEDWDKNTITFDGMKNTITLGIQLKQYETEKYPARYAGLFVNANQVAESSNQSTYQSTYRSATILGMAKISTYQESNGAESMAKDPGKTACSAGLISNFVSTVNGKINLTNITAGSSNHNLEVLSNYTAGGIIGQAANRTSVTLTDCTYDNISVTGRYAAGGLVGEGKAPITISGTNSLTFQHAVICNDSQSAAVAMDGFGGLIGVSLAATVVNDTTDRFVVTSLLVKSSTAPNAPTAGFAGIIGYSGADADAVIHHTTLSSSQIFGIAFTDTMQTQNPSEILNAISGTGSAGGIMGASDSTSTISDCQITASHLVGASICGAAVARNAGSMTQSNVSVTDTWAFSGLNVGGLTGFDQGDASAYDNVQVTNSSLMTNTGWGSSAAGVIGFKRKSGATDTITNCTISGNRIYSNNYAGGIIAKQDANLQMNTVSIQNCSIGTYITSNNFVGGVQATDISSGNTTYASNLTVCDNRLFMYHTSANNSDQPCGGISGNVLGTLYGSNILFAENTMGVVNLANNDESGYKILQDTTTTLTVKNKPSNPLSSVFVMNADAASKIILTAVSKQRLDAKYSDCGGSGAANAAIVYADYDGIQDTQQATLGEQIPRNPSKSWVPDEIWYGDGIAPGNPGKIFDALGTTNTSYASQSFSLLTKDNKDSYLQTIGAYTTGSLLSQLPVLKIEGDVNRLVEDYLNLLTNGGFSKYKAISSQFTVQQQSYQIDNNTVSPGAKSASIQYKNGAFVSSQVYDKLDKNGGTFTVLTVTFQNPTSATQTSDFSIQIPIYYPQILTAITHVSLKANEEYLISEFVDHKTDDINVSHGDTFTAYLEYVYNEIRMADDWQYDKCISFTDQSKNPLSIPAGTKLTLIDLNTPSSNGYQAYYHDPLTADTASISLSSFHKDDADKTKFQPVNLNALPAYQADKAIYQKADAPADYGMERYLVVLELGQQEDAQKLLYHIWADINKQTVIDHNVLLEDTQILAPVTVWPKATASADFASAANSSTVISNNTAITADLNLHATFPSGYEMLNLPQYGYVQYKIVNNTGAVVALPAGTVAKIGNKIIPINEDTSSLMQALTNDDGTLQNLLQHLTGDKFSATQTIQLDFSGVSGEIMNTTFAGESYQLVANFYLTSDTTHPTNGVFAKASANLTREISDSVSFTVNVNPGSLLHLGVNALDPTNLTNNGVISFTSILDLSSCTQQQLDALTDVKLTFSLYRKANGTDIPVDMGSYLEQPLTQVDYTVDQIAALKARESVSAQHQIQVKIPTDAVDFSNYRLVVTASANGYPFQKTDYFIYTLAKIKITFLN